MAGGRPNRTVQVSGNDRCRCTRTGERDMRGLIKRGRIAVVAVGTAALSVAAALGTSPPATASARRVFDPHGATTEVATGTLHRDADDFPIGSEDPLTGAQTSVHSTVYTRDMPAGWTYPLIVM